ncbi:MAG: helix-turn-helix transcriptional regulator [Thermoplasmata archaeon]|nr:helix-turn-helix transcriptional regulator [Thermoplasmata archaeon]
MDFQIRVVESSPLTGEDDYRKAVEKFLKLIGYMNENDDSHSLSYRLFELFLLYPDKYWEIDELISRLNATKSAIYRHLNKLKAMDLLEEGKSGEGQNVRKTYRMRYGNFAKAWSFVEAHVRVAMENYGESVSHIQKLIERRFLNE